MEDKDYQIADYQGIAETYFETMGSPILRGRAFTRQEAEEANQSVMIVNAALADRLWPGQDAMGKAIITGTLAKPVRHVVVGVVADTHQLGPDTAPRAQMFLPSRSFRDMSLTARTSGDPSNLGSAVTNQVLSLDKDQPIAEIHPMEEVLSGSMGEQRFGMSLMIAFAALALVLASVGLYGVLAYVVSQRTQEIGIRMALGARRQDVLKMVVKQGMLFALGGIAIGLAGAVIMTREMSSLLFGVSATDPLTFLLTAGILVVVAAFASYIPARRATKVDPMIALRYE